MNRETYNKILEKLECKNNEVRNEIITLLDRGLIYPEIREEIKEQILELYYDTPFYGYKVY